MRVTLKSTITGSRDGVRWPAIGEVVDLPDDEARQLVDFGMAETVAEPTPAPVVAEVADEVPAGEVADAVPVKAAPRPRKSVK